MLRVMEWVDWSRIRPWSERILASRCLISRSHSSYSCFDAVSLLQINSFRYIDVIKRSQILSVAIFEQEFLRLLFIHGLCCIVFNFLY